MYWVDMGVLTAEHRAGIRTRPDPDRGGWLERRAGLLLAAIVLGGGLIRFVTLDQQSFWSDEALTHGYVVGSLGHVFTAIPQTESNPPLYYVLLWLWSRVLGSTEVGLRSFSAVCGTLTIPMMWLVARRLGGSRLGVIAALLTAFNPFLFWYSQEARTYALVVLLAVLLLQLLLRALERPTHGRLLAWGAVGALAICTHYFSAFFVCAQAIWLGTVLYRRGLLNPAAALSAIGPLVIMAGALLPLFIREHDSRASWILGTGSLPFRTAVAIGQGIVGTYQPVHLLIEPLAGASVVVALALLVTRTETAELRAMVLPFTIGVGGALLALAVAVVGQDYIDSRNMLPGWPALALVVAAGFGASRARMTGALALGALLAIDVVCITALLATPSFQRPDWRDAFRAVGRTTAPRALVTGFLSYAPSRVYLPSATLPRGNELVVRGVDVVYVANLALGHTSPRLPGANVPPPVIPGFQLAAQRRTSHYLVLRYDAPRPVGISVSTLRPLEQGGTNGWVMLERPSSPAASR